MSKLAIAHFMQTVWEQKEAKQKLISEMLIANTRTIVERLGGKYISFQFNKFILPL
jgi:hypothetical protein